MVLELHQMAQWLHDYDCRHWIVEENGFQSAIRQDAAIKEFTLKRELELVISTMSIKLRRITLYLAKQRFGWKTMRA